MTRAEERALLRLEEVAREVAATFRPAPYTTGERALTRLNNTLEFLDGVRESTTEHGSEEDS
jgi:hypothetical protein